MGACATRIDCLTRDETTGAYLTSTTPAATRRHQALFNRSTSSLARNDSIPLGFKEVAPGVLEPDDPGHELEWRIVEKSINTSEFELLQSLAKRVEDLDTHPACNIRPLGRQPQVLLRYLRARDGNVDKAEKMFRDMLNWRHSFQVDAKVSAWRREQEFGETPLAHQVKKYRSEANICDDRHGIPVKLIRLSVCDSNGAVREFGKEAVLIDSLATLEDAHQRIRAAMFQEKKLIRGQIQIIDVGDYGKHGVPNWLGRMKDAARNGPALYKVFDNNYPETVRTVFILRTGPLTNMLWNMVLPLVPQRTKRKLRIFGFKAQEWIAELRRELKEFQELPLFLEEDSEEAFKQAWPRGGIIPVGARTMLEPEGQLYGEGRRLSLPIRARHAADGGTNGEVTDEVSGRWWPRPLMVMALLLTAVAILTADASTRALLFNGAASIEL